MDANHKMILLSRRELLRSSGSLLASLFVQKLAAGPTTPEGIQVNLAQEFANATMKAISPDGTKLYLEDWGNLATQRALLKSVHGKPYRPTNSGFG